MKKKIAHLLLTNDEFRYAYIQTCLRYARFWNGISKFRPLEKLAIRKWRRYTKQAHAWLGVGLAKAVMKEES